MWWFPWIFLAISLSSCILITRAIAGKRNYNAQLPPSPSSLPIIGNLHQILKDMPHISFANLAKIHGPVMTLHLGQMTTIVISSPDTASELIHKNDIAISSRSVPDSVRALRHHELSVAWLPANAQWKNLRRICSTELFTSRRLDANESLRTEKVRELIAYISECCDSHRVVDVDRVVFATTLNLISNTIFSVDLVRLNLDSKTPEFIDLIKEIMKEAASSNLSDFFPCLKMIDPQGRRRSMTAYFKRLHAIFDENIDRRLSGSCVAKHDDLLDALLHEGGSSTSIDRCTIKSLFSDLFAAGSDTSSITVEWAMAELIRNPRVMARARAEIATVIEPDKVVVESDIEKLHYLRAVVKETLRLHPPLPFLLPRETESRIALDQYMIPEGVRVVVNMWAIGRDETVWPEPNEFRPERFFEEEIDFKGRDFKLSPFGAGRRICPGIPLASRMVHLVLASLLQRFEWKLEDGMEPENMDMSEEFGISLSMAVPLRAVPVVP
ncbi:Geraniol 8-hydroxylase protein [Dioscorea alata]|uniref:Geraniol 8-hydroxylase protein n=1 Tax=Dioscorea alata TaxID=55571 RepID=A0ACB7WFQ2_DIOAL|nr:Geraniol 8-hydroxylase protein [Dioscorea alata]